MSRPRKAPAMDCDAAVARERDRSASERRRSAARHLSLTPNKCSDGPPWLASIECPPSTSTLRVAVTWTRSRTSVIVSPCNTSGVLPSCNVMASVAGCVAGGTIWRWRTSRMQSPSCGRLTRIGLGVHVVAHERSRLPGAATRRERQDPEQQRRVFFLAHGAHLFTFTIRLLKVSAM